MYHDQLDGTGEYSHNQIDDFIKGGGASSATHPSTGTWAVGDRVWNSNPSPSDYIGWVCVIAGSPGVWKGFGEIEA